MRKKIIIPALVAAFVAAGAPAVAQDYGRDSRDSSWQQRDSGRLQDRHDVDSRWQDERDSRRRDADSSYDRRHDTDRRHDRDDRDDHSEGGWGRTESFSAGYDGAGPYHDLRRGDALPSRYRTHQYVVDNYRAHHLTPPPAGYRWVQTGADYVLVQAATGIIAEIAVGR